MEPNLSERGRTVDQIAKHDTELCRVLWMAAIMQAIEDASSPSEKSSYRKIQKDARDWLDQSPEDSDFATACQLVGVDPRVVKRYYRAVRSGRIKSAGFHWIRKNRLIRPPANSNVKQGGTHDRTQ
ncbi:MAG: hypothetical protein AAGA58_06345 [Verrucomicrobiota bacterium]